MSIPQNMDTVRAVMEDLFRQAYIKDIVTIDYTNQPEGALRADALMNSLRYFKRWVRSKMLLPGYQELYDIIECTRVRRIDATIVRVEHIPKLLYIDIRNKRIKPSSVVSKLTQYIGTNNG